MNSKPALLAAAALTAALAATTVAPPKETVNSMIYDRPSNLGDYVAHTETYPGGKPKASWSMAGALLHGKQTLYYENGRRQWEATFDRGRKAGVETWWSADGTKQWERNYSGDTWTWKIFDASGRVTAESHWKRKQLLDANTEGPLVR